MPPAYEILLLNTAIPQIQAAQSGDTYVCPRDIAFSAALTLSAGTPFAVPYLNASKVVTTGSALTFDGTKLGVASGNIDVVSANFAGSPLIAARFNASNLRMGIGTGNTNGFPFLGVNVNNAANDNGTFDIANWASRIRLDNGVFQVQTSTASGSAGGAITWSTPLYLDSSGNLGIGTNNPVAKLSVAGDILAPSFNTNTTYTIGIQDAQTNAFVNTNRGNLQIQASSAKPGANGMGGGNLTLKAGTSDIGGAGYDGNVSIVAGYNTLSSALSSGVITFTTNNTERARITSVGNLKLGGTADRATTVGTNHLDIFNGTAPVGTLTNGISIYSSSGEAYVMDAAGNATLFSPNDAETNEWIFKSKHTPTGKVLKIDVERLLKFINDHFGLDAVHEFVEE